MFPLLCTSLLPCCWLCSITSAAQGTVTCLNAQVAKGLLLLLSSLLPTHVRTLCLVAAGIVEVWEASRAGLKEVRNWRPMQLLTSGAFHSTELHWPLRAVWNRFHSVLAKTATFGAFWKPFIPTAFECFLDSRKPWSMSALTAAPVLCLPSLSTAPCTWEPNSEPAQPCNLAQSAGKKTVRSLEG